jgi:hypothetical protein
MGGGSTCSPSNGDNYIDDWEADMVHGKGTFLWAKGDVYEGNWRLGKVHGHKTKHMAKQRLFYGRVEE